MKKTFTLILFLVVALSGVEGFSQDSTNTFDYNYKKGIEHYNKGVDIINASSEDAVIKADSLKAEAKKEFEMALPFLLKAYSINSKTEKVLKGLQGVYFSMYDFEKADKYKKELEALKK